MAPPLPPRGSSNLSNNVSSTQNIPSFDPKLKRQYSTLTKSYSISTSKRKSSSKKILFTTRPVLGESSFRLEVQ